MTLTLEIPDSVAEGRSPEVVGRELLEVFAVESYKAAKMSMRQIGELLGHESRWDTQRFLADHDAWNCLTVDEILTDAENAAKFSIRRK